MCFIQNSNSKKFSTSNVKNNSHLQMDIFCHFDFCHSRRNGFKQRRKVNFVVYSWPDAIVKGMQEDEEG